MLAEDTLNSQQLLSDILTQTNLQTNAELLETDFENTSSKPS